MVKYEVTDSHFCKDYRRPSNAKRMRVATVYVKGRPFDTGDIAGDFEWRHSNKPNKMLLSDVLSVATEELKKYNKDISDQQVEVKFNNYAGCSMCPCSPGYTVMVMKNGNNIGFIGQPLDIWVAIKEE